MKHWSFRSTTVRAAVSAIVAAAGLSGYSQGVSAAEEADGLEEVTVTGSRIRRPDLEANSPLVTVDSAALEQKSGLNIESYLNQLPAYNPAASPTVKGGSGGNTDVQISAVNSVGIASVSLRGFGANRSLVLVDGRRAIPTNALMVVDVNSIPSSMIQRVEIISGGASATYGADAIGGVSNFLLRRDFQGAEIDAQWGTTEAGDGDELRTSAILGTAFADGRGNLVFASEYYDRKAAFEKNRDFYTDAWKDPTVAGNFLGFVMGANGYAFNPPGGAAVGPGNPATNYYPANATYATILGRSTAAGAGPTFGVVAFPGTVGGAARFNPDGTIFNPNGNNAGSWRGAAIDDYTYSRVNAYDTTYCNSPVVATCAAGPQLIQLVKFNETEGYASSPQTRFSFMASGTYDITDDLSFQSSARFAQSTTRTFLSTTNASFGWEVSVPYNPVTDSPVVPQGTVVNGTAVDYRNPATVQAILANPAAYANPGFIAHGAAGAQHPVPLQHAILLNSRINNTAPWVLETYPLQSFGRRATNNVNTAWQIETGLTYRLPFKDWTAEAYYSRGESSTYNVAYGNNSLARWRALVTAADYGRNSNLQSNRTNNGPGANPGFGSVAVPCTSGFYETIFNGDAQPSADCRYAAEAPLQTRTQNQQDIGELNLQGGLFELPAGELRGALGYQYRRNAAQFNPDILQSTASFTDQVIGVYPTGYLDAQIKAQDIYAEALVPVLSDFVVQKFELEIGARYSDYDKTDSTTTYKINGNIVVNDYVRLRGGYNRATRAPNLGEMFLPLQQIFTANGVYGDPCGVLSNSPFGAGGAIENPNLAVGGPARLAGGQTTAGAQSAYLICRAQMAGAAGNWAQDNPGATFFYGPQSNQPAAAGGGFAWVNQIGNAGLDSEKADTWTAGVVLRSPFENALASNITATIDWYSIAINDAILPYSIDYARYLCYGAVQVSDAAGAAAQARSAACLSLPRSTTNGGVLTTQVSYDNQAIVRTSGIDFTLDWRAQFADMGLSSVPGSIGLNINGTWLDTYKTKQSPAAYDPLIEWKGSIGPNLQGFNAGAYDYRVFTSLSYSLPSLSVSLRWRHLPRTDSVPRAQENAIRANNAAVAAGAPGVILSYTPSPAYDFASYNVFDLSGSWTINDTFSLRFGVDNLFDKDPVISSSTATAATAGRPYDPNQSPAANAAAMAAICGGAPGCINPTSYSIASTGQGSTAGGYYDVLGRRYYLGLKARF